MGEIPNLKMHNVRFYKPKPKAVYCMTIQPEENKLALSRSDASVEIWNLQNSPFLEKRIASSTENFSIEGLAWCDHRLFSVGLHGLLIEYDLYKLDVKSKAAVTGEAAFCLDVDKQKSRIAVGTEKGFLNIFQITEEEILFEKFLDKQEGRILCLKYDHSGEYIISGSLDSVRIWSARTNQALHKMITGRSEHNKSTIVWCLAVTRDFTIISGDSRGILTVWDGKIGAQIDSYQSHVADILTLTLSEDEESLYCAGVDPNIVNYVRVKVKNNSLKWVRSVQRKIHDHDVRALMLHKNKLYSSGVDGYLACSYHPPKTLLKFPPILQNPVVLCQKSRLILLRYPKFFEIWSLGESGNNSENSFYQVERNPKKLILVQKIVKIDGEKRKEGIITATISDDGNFVVYSTRFGVRIFKLIISNDEKYKLVPLDTEDLGEIPCINAIFTRNNKLILTPNSGGLQVVEFDGDRPVVFQNITTKTDIEDTITLLAASSSAQYLVGGDSKANVAVWVLKNGQYSSYCKLPKFKSAPTAMKIHPKIDNLVVAYSDGSIIEYDLANRQLTKFSRSLAKNPPKQLISRTGTIRNVTFDPRRRHVIMLHDDDSIVVIDKDKKNFGRDTKTQKLEKESVDFSIKSIRKYKHLVGLDWLSDDEIVAVEVNPLTLMGQLPPCLIQNTFGKK